MKKLTKKLPDSPGVYLLKKGKRILYVGKATSLKDRVRSYFNTNAVLLGRGPAIVNMVEEATSVVVQKTDSVLEAVILEAALIKKHQPQYNTKEKDDKSFQFVVITKEEFPRVLVVRGKDLAEWDKGKIGAEYGPFVRSSELKEAIKIVRKIFPFRDRCVPQSGRPCFERQIGLCPGVCTGEIDAKEYGKIIGQIKMFFAGKKKRILSDLRRQMTVLAKAERFEEASAAKRKMFALTHIQDVALLKRDVAKDVNGIAQAAGFRIEAYDVAHISGTDTVGVMTVVVDGTVRKSEYKKFKVRGDTHGGDTLALREILLRRLKHPEWPLPNLIVVDGAAAQLHAAENILLREGLAIPVVGVVKGDGHRPKGYVGDLSVIKKHEQEILLANSEAHRFAIGYHRQIRDRVRK